MEGKRENKVFPKDRKSIGKKNGKENEKSLTSHLV
jgi:hypothetical protein